MMQACASSAAAPRDSAHQLDGPAYHPVRQIARRYWQPDAEADMCSIANCETEFSSRWGQRRHHCRQCGRVVCGACSRGQRLLMPPIGQKGLGTNVRICDGCLRNSETFVFCHPETLSSGVPLRRGLSSQSIECAHSGDFAGGANFFQSPIARVLDVVARSPAAQASSLDDTMQRMQEAPLSTLSTAETPVSDRTAADRATTKPLDTSKTTKPLDTSNAPLFIRTAQRETAHDPAEARLAQCSYYQGLKLHEPLALEALLGERRYRSMTDLTKAS